MNGTADQFALLINRYLDGTLPLQAFWEQFTFSWAEADESVVSDSDAAFFSEVAERLHYVDFRSPSEAPLEDPEDFRRWLGEAVVGRVGT